MPSNFRSIQESLTQMRQLLGEAARASRGAADADSKIIVRMVPAPSGLSKAMLDGTNTGECLYWSSPEEYELSFVGWGACARVRVTEGERFVEAQKQLARLMTLVECPPECLPYVRFFGGGAFAQDERALDDSWEDFAAASFLLPQLLYVQDHECAYFMCCSAPSKIASSLELLNSALALSETADDAFAEAGAGEIAILGRQESCDRAQWQQLFDKAQLEFRSGQLQKVVAARRVSFELAAPPRLSHILTRMQKGAEACTHFFLRLGERCFFAATPETLVRKQGQKISSEALAGTVSAEPALARELLNSEKDREEHAYVVDALRSALTSHCHELSVPEQPRLKHLRKMVHLWTPIEGSLLQDESLLSLVDALHPTPAVGGLPRQEALRFIAVEEELERGWYAAPFGWLDLKGNGSFVVALRSALLAGRSVHTYAGAGLVGRSNAKQEFDETELKMSAMLGALGLAS